MTGGQIKPDGEGIPGSHATNPLGGGAESLAPRWRGTKDSPLLHLNSHTHTLQRRAQSQRVLPHLQRPHQHRRSATATHGGWQIRNSHTTDCHSIRTALHSALESGGHGSFPLWLTCKVEIAEYWSEVRARFKPRPRLPAGERQKEGELINLLSVGVPFTGSASRRSELGFCGC
jgi:hypothetical protein